MQRCLFCCCCCCFLLELSLRFDPYEKKDRETAEPWRQTRQRCRMFFFYYRQRCHVSFFFPPNPTVLQRRRRLYLVRPHRLECFSFIFFLKETLMRSGHHIHHIHHVCHPKPIVIYRRRRPPPPPFFFTFLIVVHRKNKTGNAILLRSRIRR